MGLALALAGCVVFVVGLVFTVLWLIPSLRSQHPGLGRGAVWALVGGFLLFLGGGIMLSDSKTSRQPPLEAPSSPPAIRVPPD
jgi:hypothetical protein